MSKEEWYQLDVKDVFIRLATREEGLTTSEARARLEKYGHNRLEEDKGPSPMVIFFNQFRNPLIYILFFAGIITLALAHYIDTIVIMSVVALNATIGFVQEYRAEEAMKRLAQMVAPKARVLRDGLEVEVDAGDVVPGDVVVLTSGVRVPADMRLFMVKELKIDESALTGESVPVEKQVERIADENLVPGDQLNLAFMGTVVSTGRGRGVVVETGTRTELGRISEEVKKTEVTKTPLLVRMDHFSKRIGIAIILLGAIVVVYGVALGESIVDMFFTAVALAVGVIPEGLPAVITITLSIGVNRMSKRNTIIRKLPAVETLGSTTVICSDKTGTLTKNEMTVKKVYTPGRLYEVTGTGYDLEGSFLINGSVLSGADLSLDLTLIIGMLCNESKVYLKDDIRKVDGDPTEGALIISAMKRGFDPETLSQEYPTIDIVPFESERGYMATLHEHDGKKIVFVKGAPEKIFVMFKSACHIDGRVEACSHEQLLDVAHSLASEGLRVLAMAYREMPPETQEITHEEIEKGGLIFAGYQAMIDPPRPEAVEAVALAKKAGIRVVMVTGDHPLTARSIAEQIGIVGKEAEVITGREIEEMSDEELYRKVKDVSIFSRVSPHHKFRIVKAFQKHGEIVAVTGDGVNDAPALKAAQIGVAMGISGTDVAKDASDMVLTDDNFASIYSAVKEGRIVFENIRKVTLFLVATGIGLAMTIPATLLLGMPLPFLPTQLLWLNLVTNGLQDVALAFEREEEGVEKIPPRDPKAGVLFGLIPRLVITGIVLMLGTLLIFSWQINSGATLGQARTAALTTMVFFQFFYAFMSRSERRTVFSINPFSNRFLLISIAAAFVAQILAIYHPALQFILRTEPIPLETFMWVLLVASSILMVEVEKHLRKKSGRSKSS
ncbi:MAG: HAD-IC family P-type ATPase [Nitrososphaerales archaeon]